MQASDNAIDRFVREMLLSRRHDVHDSTSPDAIRTFTPVSHYVQPRTIAFRENLPALDLFPIDLWTKTTAKQWRRASASLLLGGEPLGYPRRQVLPFRERLPRNHQSFVCIYHPVRQASLRSATSASSPVHQWLDPRKFRSGFLWRQRDPQQIRSHTKTWMAA